MSYCKERNIPPVLMIVLDGFGIGKDEPQNAIANAKTPTIDMLMKKFPHSELEASGESVGLIDDIVGNSEVGHMNLGAGRIVYQDLAIINKAIANKSFFRNRALMKAMKHAKKNHSRLHLLGMLSDAGVHSYLPHLFALLEMAKKMKVREVYIHGITDGRDTHPTSALSYLDLVERLTKEMEIGKIASLSGRFYAMDRVDQWERAAKVYHALVSHKPIFQGSPQEYVKENYKKGTTDEYLPPMNFELGDEYDGRIRDEDSIIFWHLRSDRARQLTKAFVQDNFTQFFRGKMLRDTEFVAFTDFGDDLKVETAFPTAAIQNTLSRVLSKQPNFQHLYVAEAEKFPHVSYFFHGSSTERLANEDLIKIDSPNVQNYSQRPAMSSDRVTDIVLQDIDENYSRRHDFTLVNFSNADMIAHTGNYQKTIEAIECIDQYIQKLYKKIQEKGGTLIITADHGNAEDMFHIATKEVNPSHTKSKVPFMLIPDSRLSKNIQVSNGILANVAPTVLDLLRIEKPKDMTHNSLIT